MNNTFIFLLMIFMHVIDDFNLQGWLASAKQKEYWMENAPQDLHKYDYICALIIHSFSWAFMIMLPIAYYISFEIDAIFVVVLVANTIIHAAVDDLKANKREINLWVDQLIHILQIVLIAVMFLAK